MEEKEKACFFTGHRRIPADKYEQIKNIIEQEVINKYNEGIKIFIAGGAYGFDHLAANAVVKLKKTKYKDIKLYLYLPSYEYEEYLSYEQRCELHGLKCNADKFEVITKSHDDIYDCIVKRNKKLVEDAVCGIAYKKTNRSGTAQTMSFAKKKGIPVINIAEMTE